MEVYNNNLGTGFSEIVYKDTLELEFKKCEKLNTLEKRIYSKLQKALSFLIKFYADFVIFDKIILEVKGKNKIADEDIAQCINYLKYLEIIWLFW